MEWSEVLDSLLEHPYWFDFQGGLAHARRVQGVEMRVTVDDVEQAFAIRNQYVFGFGPGPCDESSEGYNAFGLYVGADILRIQSVFRVCDELRMYRDLVNFETPSPQELERALSEWGKIPEGSIARCDSPPPHSRKDFIDLLRGYTQ